MPSNAGRVLRVPEQRATAAPRRDAGLCAGRIRRLGPRDVARAALAFSWR
jgi:hypothetical protein